MVRPRSRGPDKGIAVPDIFDEVDEDLRAERARRLLRRYGGTLVLAAVAVVAGVGGYQAWQWYDARQTAGVAQSFIAATQLADSRSEAEQRRATPLFDAIAKRGGVSYRTLARLREAGLRGQAGDAAGASALWDQVSRDGAAERMLRDFASLQWATANVDAADPAAVAARLEPLTAPDNPWHAMALETQALLALRQGQHGTARNTLRRLAGDPQAPQGVRQQAANLMAQFGDAEKAGGS